MAQRTTCGLSVQRTVFMHSFVKLFLPFLMLIHICTYELQRCCIIKFDDLF